MILKMHEARTCGCNSCETLRCIRGKKKSVRDSQDAVEGKG